MFVVTGEPRSGTSLMMRTLEKLGVDVLGDKFPAVKKLEKIKTKTKRKEDLEKKIERIKKLNPNGFYEISGVVMQGLREMPDDYRGKAIKIITNGVYERTLANGRTIGTPINFINKAILCLRNPKYISVSQTELDYMVEVHDAGGWGHQKTRVSPTRYISGMGGFLSWYNKQTQEDKDKFLPIDYDDFIDDPSATIDQIIAHLGINPTQGQKQSALANVNPSLRRSIDFEEWPSDLVIDGDVAERTYEAMKSKDNGAMASIEIELSDIIQNQRLEKVKWTDEDTWVNVMPRLYRGILSNYMAVKDNLIKSLERKKQSNLIPTACSYYSRDQNTYTIQRPEDLGPLIRPLVKCNRDDDLKTIEQCKTCWQRGWIIEGTPVPPQMTV